TDETSVIALEHPRLLVIEPKRMAPAIEIGDAGIERRIEINRVAVASEQRRDLPLCGLDLVRGVGASEDKEHIGHALQLAAALLQCRNGVGEAGLRRV